MSRLRKLIPLFLAVALTLAVAVPVLAQTRALYQCTVYENNVLVGAGKTVAAFVGTETTARITATTNANGVAIIDFSVAPDEIGDPVRFEVDGIDAAETPDVNVSIEGLSVRLDYSGGVAYYTLGVTVSPSGTGTVARSPSLTQYPAGTVVTLTGSGVSGWVFDRWSGTNNNNINPTTVTMNANKSVTAYFKQPTTTGKSFASWLYDEFVECLVD